MEPEHIFYILCAGILATLSMDAWQLLLNRLAKIPRPDWAALGRWVLGMSELGLVQVALISSPKRHNEAIIGWCLHYVVGIAYATLYFYMLEALNIPALNLTLWLSIISLLIPWCVIMPCTGYGFFASNAPKPNLVRIYNLMTHLVFFLSLNYVGQVFLSRV